MLRHLIDEILDFIKEALEKEEIWILLGLLLLGSSLIVSFTWLGWQAILNAILRFLAATWWLWFFLLFFPFICSLWLYWRNCLYASRQKYKLLEIKISSQNQKDAKAMEQVLVSLNSLRDSPIDWWEKWFTGEFVKQFSLEIISFGGQVHFYILTPAKFKDMVEAAFFAHYPDLEMDEVKDYTDRLPKGGLDMWQKGYNLWGSELVLNKEGMYPIKTYPNFEEIKEERRVDPISSFLEVASKLNSEEMFGIQMIISPHDRTWAKKWDESLEKLRKYEEKTISASVDASQTMPLIIRSPGQTEVLKQVENNLAKPAFETLIRFIYLAPKTIFQDSKVYRGIVAAIQQYNTLHLNSFRYNWNTMTKISRWFKPYLLFPKLRTEMRRQRLLYNFRYRMTPSGTFAGKWLTSRFFNSNFVSEFFDLNTESLATLFHVPTVGVLTGPHLPRVESRKAGPPAGLAIFGEEAEIEKYQ